MTSRVCVLIVTALVAFCALGGCSPGEPSYQGRPLTAWLTDFDSHLPEVREGAAGAVRKMGTNTLPVFIARIRHDESRIKSELPNMPQDDSPVTVSPDHTAQ